MLWVEGVAASGIWAFTHLDVVGKEGMGGGQSSWGYYFLISVLFRPFLMVLSFVFAVEFTNLFGWYFSQIFLTAIGDAQINSMTGLFSICGFVGIYIMVSTTIISTGAALTSIIPNKVLAWAGGQINSDQGRELIGKVEGLGGKMASGGGTTVGGFAKASRAADSAKQGKESSAAAGRAKMGEAHTDADAENRHRDMMAAMKGDQPR